MAGAGFARGRCSSVMMLGKLPCCVVPVLGLRPSWRAMPAPEKQQRLPSAGAGASSPRPHFLCVHTFLLLLLFTGRKNRFPAKEVGAQSPEAGWQMMPRCADLAAPHFALSSSPSQKPHIWLWRQWLWGGCLTAGPSPVAGLVGGVLPCSWSLDQCEY